jgi:tetratricopeptide (TPR) repeat protein
MRRCCVGRRAWLSALIAALLLAGCGTAPVASVPVAPGEGPTALTEPPTPLAAFEIAQWQSARELERKGKLADAAWAWEVLTVLKPDNAEYRSSLASVRQQIDAAVADRLRRASQAQKKGNLDIASVQYLTVLSLQPGHAQAADALRAIERERNKRSYLGKPSRITLAKRAPETDKPLAGSRNPPDRNDLEHASLLAAQGELDEAIGLLERRVAADRRDNAARLLLADLYLQKADKLAARAGNKSAAIAALHKGVKLDPSHPKASLMLKQLQSE